MHLSIDAQTLQIRDIEITDSVIGRTAKLGAGKKRDPQDNMQAGSLNLEEMQRPSPPQPGGETKMGCFKRLDERIMARDFQRQVTELQVRASIRNWVPCMGTPEAVRAA